MPACRYGKNCQLPRCVFRHPDADDAAARVKQTVCISFLTGSCAFGNDCWNWHPATVGERQAILRVLRQRPCTNPKPCKFGEHCLFDCHNR